MNGRNKWLLAGTVMLLAVHRPAYDAEPLLWALSSRPQHPVAGTSPAAWLGADVGKLPGSPQADPVNSNPLESVTENRVKAALGKLPLYFIENRGQADPRVAFYIQGSDTSAYFTPDGVTFTLSGPREESENGAPSIPRAETGAATKRWVVKLDFVGASTKAGPTGQDRTSAVVSYFKGAMADWKTGLPTYGSVVYRDLWPGIDLVYTGSGARLKYTFVVQPGADPNRIRLAYRGATDVRLTGEGRIAVSTPLGGFEDDMPYAYQEVGDKRVEVPAAYDLDSTSTSYRYGFRLGTYDRSRPLVLDPALLYCGYIGGSSSDDGYAITVDSSGYAYVTGTTWSSEVSFPVMVGPDLTLNGIMDAFVAKVEADGTALVYCGYIGGTGGSGQTLGYGIAVDGSGNAYVTGQTTASEPSFPVIGGPDLTQNGNVDTFVAKVNDTGTALTYCGFIGGSGDDYGRGIAVDGSGNAYVSGYTSSDEVSFPETVGPDLTHNGGSYDAYVAKVNDTGTALTYCGYIGGSNIDFGRGIAVDSSGNAYIEGETSSTEASFPETVGPGLTYNGGLYDAFVAKVNDTGTALTYCGYIGGSGDDYGYDIAVDNSDNAYVTGYTSSDQATFPVTVGPDLTYNNNTDAFVAKVNASGTALIYCGYIGGSSWERGYGIDVDSSGNAYVTGYTASNETTFPETAGPDLTYNGGSEDAFVAKVNAAGTALTYCGYIGGSNSDQGYGIVVDGYGNAYVVGKTSSDQVSFPETVGPDLIHNGGSDAFVAKVILNTPLYRSVGIAATDLNTNSRTVEISGTTATFSGPMPDDVGVGDVLQYEAGITYLAFIHGRTSDTVYTVRSSTGGTPQAAASGTTVGVYRAYTSLSNWAAQDENDTLDDTVEDFDSSTDLVTNNTAMMVACYADGVDTTEVTIDGWTTGIDNYIKIYTPRPPDEVGTTQRHDGTAGTGYRLSTSSPDDGIIINDEYVRIEGLEISSYYDGVWITAIGVNNEIRISHCLIHDFSYSSSSGIWSDDADAVVYMWNNIIYNLPASGSGVEATDASEIYIYNNTILDAGNYGFHIASGVCTAKNNLVANCGNSNYATSGTGSFHSSSDYNWSDDTTDPGGANDINSGDGGWSDVTFADEAGDDFHLDSADTGAKDKGTDLSSDANLAVSLDIDGGRRSTPWDIGADDVNATTAVDLLSFYAQGLDRAVALRWETGSEINNLGFHLYRSTEEEGSYQRITSRLVPGLGSSPAGARYSYLDEDLKNGVTYYYKLEDIETTGKLELHGPVWATPVVGAVGEVRPGGERGESRITVGDPSNNQLRVVDERAGVVLLELVTRGFYAEPRGDGTLRLDVPGFMMTEEEGYPSIPVKRTWVEALAGRNVELASVESYEEERFHGLRPWNAGEPGVVASRRGTVRFRQTTHRRIAGSNDVYPAEAARLMSVGYQGDVKKALVELAPFRWDATKQKLVLSHRLVVRLAFRGRDRADVTRDGVRGRRYRRRPSHEPSRVMVRLVTEEPGLYGVSFEELFQGRRLGALDASRLRVSRQGETVPYHLEPDTGWFGPGKTLYFVSAGAEANPYGHEAVYELEVGIPGERMPVRSASPSGETVPYYWEVVEKEEDHIYQAVLVKAPDRWLWSALYAPALKRYAFDVSAPAAITEPSRLEVWLQGGTDLEDNPDHHLRIRMNGNDVGEVSWNGREAQKVELELLPGWLREGFNELELENVGDTGTAYSMVMLNRYRVSYPRLPLAVEGRIEGEWSESGIAEVVGLSRQAQVIETSNSGPVWLYGAEPTASGLRFQTESGSRYLAVSPDAVQRVTGIRCPLKSRLKKTDNRADYVMIGPREYVQAAGALVELRQSQGLRVKAVAVEEVFSEFGFGEQTPKAIKEFLSYAYHQWEQSPRYVVLLGDGTYDFKDNLGTGVQNRVPPLMVTTTYLETASDPAYAAVNGEDLLPDLAIGRLPASTLEELIAMVEKIISFEISSRSFEGKTVLVTDNPDQAGDFVADAESLSETVLSGRKLRKIYMSELGAAATRFEIHQSFDEGCSLMSYIGHGGIHVWADENVLNVDDVGSLATQPEQPLLLTMNCLNGYFHFPYFGALAEELLKAEGKGVVAAFSPSGMSLNHAAHMFHQALLEEILESGHSRLGDAVLAAQAAYAASGALPEMIAIYHLFGDPAMKLQ